MSKPSATDDLLDFVRKAKEERVDDRALIAILRQHGWSERRAYAALSKYYAERVGTIPERGGAFENARDAFLYMLAFVTLGIWTVALVWLVDILADWAFPSSLDLSYTVTTFRDQAAGQIASLMLAFPIFLAVSSAIVRETRRRPEALESGVRKWLTYIALVVTAVVLLGDGIWFLTQFLLGDVTMRFAIRAFALFAVSGGVFWYYLGTVRREEAPKSRDAFFGWSATVIVLVALGFGFFGIGSPSHNRDVDFDQRKVRNLKEVARNLSDYYSREKTLPQTLAAAVPYDPTIAQDPQSGVPFEYVPAKNGAYSVCADFLTVDRAQLTDNAPFWKHPAGHFCFHLNAAQPPPS